MKYAAYRTGYALVWLYRRPGLIRRAIILALQIVGIVGLIALFAAARGGNDHPHGLQQLQHRVMVLEHACVPRNTEGGVTQCDNPNTYDTSPYSPGNMAWRHDLTEDDLARIDQVVRLLGSRVNEIEMAQGYVGCHARDTGDGPHVVPMAWRQDVRVIAACLRDLPDTQYPLTDLRVTR